MERFGEAGRRWQSLVMVWALEMTSAPPSPMSRRFDLLRRVAVTCLISKAWLKRWGASIRQLHRYLWSVPMHVPPLLRQPPYR